MGLLDICSSASYWRGLDYFERKRVVSYEKTSEYEYDALVQGSEAYHVHLDIRHPKKSTCTCPYADGKSIVCKHKVAVYFAIFPEEAKKALGEWQSIEEDQEERERAYDQKLAEEIKHATEYVQSLSEDEVRARLINYLVDDAMKYEEDPYEDDDRYW
ncbi:MAG: SWIM zinc finger family protein [Bacilli bacterium]|nr:SWIM zinc finger family protein [Bacilli bacterium]